MDRTMQIGATTGRSTTMLSALAKSLLACTMVAAGPSLGWAQQTPQNSQNSHLDPRWQAWVGCWQPAAAQSPDAMPGMLSPASSRDAKMPLVCVVPASDAQSSGVDVATVADGKIVARERIDATGQKYARTRDGCNGVESADWSADGRRVYLRSDYTCPGSIRRTSTGVFAISPAGEWVDVEGIATGAGKGVRTLRYDDAGAPAGLPSEIASAISGRALAVNAARTADAAPITTANIVEATHKLDPAVVEAWLVDRGQGFSINARQLIDLADAGVPSNVTDAMVALSYPRSFAVDSAQYAGGAVDGASGALGARGYRTGRNVDVFINPSYPVGYGYSRYGYSPYDRYSPYGYYSPYSAYGRAYGGWYGVPAVIVLKGNQPTDAQSTGRLVKGRGYTQSDPGNAASAGSAHPRPSPSAGSSTSAEGRSSGSGSESTSGSGRTAKPRP